MHEINKGAHDAKKEFKSKVDAHIFEQHVDYACFHPCPSKRYRGTAEFSFKTELISCASEKLKRGPSTWMGLPFQGFKMLYSNEPFQFIDNSSSFFGDRVFCGQYWDDLAIAGALTPSYGKILMLGLAKGAGIALC